MRKFLENGTSIRVAEALKQIGYAHVTLDLQGYRRGSANERHRSPDPHGAVISASPCLDRKT
jgi:PP-loop superfamily ATP-utilizing enzyme